MIGACLHQILQLYQYSDPIPENAYLDKVVVFTLKARPGTTNSSKAKKAFLVDSISVLSREDFFQTYYTTQSMLAQIPVLRASHREEQAKAKQAGHQGVLWAAITMDRLVRPRESLVTLKDILSRKTSADYFGLSKDAARKTLPFPQWQATFSKLIEIGKGMNGLAELQEIVPA